MLAADTGAAAAASKDRTRAAAAEAAAEAAAAPCTTAPRLVLQSELRGDSCPCAADILDRLPHMVQNDRRPRSTTTYARALTGDGRRWNTFSLWRAASLAQTGFLLAAENQHPAGMEEAAPIALLRVRRP